MTDETSLAFERPEIRAAATQKGNPLDRISVRDFVKQVEIGAFQSERGTLQRIMFNVVLEVAPSAAAKFDDVDQVLSYDTITEAIEYQLSNERINLLETLAERIADRVLIHPRAVRVFVRIEKLDRIPGSLGVEIVRAQMDGDNVVSLDSPIETADQTVNPLVVFLPNTVLHGDDLGTWLDAIHSHETPVIICVEPTLEHAPNTKNPLVNKRIGLLAIEQNAWILASKDNRCVVVDSRTELDWAIKNDQLSVWAPSKIVLDTVSKPDAGPYAPLELAQWFAQQVSADQVRVLCGFENMQKTAGLVVVKTPQAF